ncbi:epoxyqueuosine reductase [Serpentinicella sp. ANB-PHB4]|uniref:4Fe-4S dicluster domain-containing protein n=1 Tax=Serpentinicella sp. ANB-PHB4 TaxID=3074076 RepID=UPI002861870C|nr:4Fe-4S dicluster domain-containing protein [Serpentinicella sp. ANB-PHB4]MDR5659388.1 epoxyqueuosine reductase [Serpentinicella sp. ANB-PHB4]
MNQEQLTKMILDLGVSKVGYCNLENLVPENYKHLNSGISFAIQLSEQIVEDIDPSEGPTHTYFHHYRTVNAYIDQISLKIMMKLQQLGYLAVAVPASQSINKDGWKYKGLFPHRTAATRAGIGWIGKNNCLVTKEFGPRVRLGTILTNMNFEYNEPIEQDSCCNCNLCVKSCPAIALKGTSWTPSIPREEILDPKACSAYMSNHYKHIGRGSVCGICIKVCPKGLRVGK